MKFGYILPNFGNKISAQELVDISRVCEEEGFDSVWATDHVVMPVEFREPYGEVLEPLTTLSIIASQTDRLRLGTSCIIIAQRNPILTAKQAATLDVFSKGRVLLGLGAGWAEKEFGFLNADFSRRGRTFDESIRLMKVLWRDDPVSFEGEFFHLREALFLPKPIRGDIPVWIGGDGPTAVRRASKLGDGWHPVGPGLEGFREGVERIRAVGRNVTISVRMTTDVRRKREDYVSATGEKRALASGSPEEIRKTIAEFESAGLEYYCASILHPSAAEIMADLKKFAADVVRSYG